MKKIIITSNEVKCVLKVSPSYARRCIRQIKQTLKKEKHQVLTLKEFCKYYGFDQEQIKKEINNLK